MDTDERYCRMIDTWLRTINQLLFVYKDTEIQKPQTIKGLLADAKELSVVEAKMSG